MRELHISVISATPRREPVNPQILEAADKRYKRCAE